MHVTSLEIIRDVLESSFSVSLESNRALITRVRGAIRSRHPRRHRNVGIPPVKTPRVFSQLRGVQNWNIRAIDLLRTIGEMTTPTTVNNFQLSSSWATYRYFWAIEPSRGSVRPFRLSDDARRIDPHQKQLLSDEFGIGMGGLLAQDFLRAHNHVDISLALDDPGNYQDISLTGEKQPDYLMWDSGTPYYVVECKGTLSNLPTSVNQIRRGLEQVPSVVFLPGQRRVSSLVVATFLDSEVTHVYVVDPPSNSVNNSSSRDQSSDKATERIGKREWRIRDNSRFEDRAWTGHEIQLLRWVEQDETADALSRELGLPLVEKPYHFPDAELNRTETSQGVYLGIRSSILPGWDRARLSIFRGLDEELVEHIRARHHTDARKRSQHLRERWSYREESTASFGNTGTCMIIEGTEAIAR